MNTRLSDRSGSAEDVPFLSSLIGLSTKTKHTAGVKRRVLAEIDVVKTEISVGSATGGDRIRAAKRLFTDRGKSSVNLNK